MFQFVPTRIYDFMGLRKLWIIISILSTAAAGVIVATHGINKGIDFQGGVKLTYHTSATANEGDIKQTLAGSGFDAQVQRFGEVKDQRFMVKVKGSEEAATALSDKITQALTAKFGAETALEGQEAVGASVGKELRVRGVKIILYVLLALLIYIGFRFDFQFAPGAIIALGHDLMITIGALVLCGVEFNLTILAALLTILGYSMNDTIIIYDRIREHGKEINVDSIERVINKSLTETLSRSILTHVTVLISVSCLYVLARGDIRDFALAFIFGVITGTYSSIYVASPIYMWLYRRTHKA